MGAARQNQGAQAEVRDPTHSQRKQKEEDEDDDDNEAEDEDKEEDDDEDEDEDEDEGGPTLLRAVSERGVVAGAAKLTAGAA